MSSDDWKRALSCVNGVVERCNSVFSTENECWAFYYLLAIFRENCNLLRNKTERIVGMKSSCLTCKYLQVIDVGIARYDDGRWIDTVGGDLLVSFCDTFEHFPPNPPHLPRCSLPLTDDQCASFLLVFLRCLTKIQPKSKISLEEEMSVPQKWLLGLVKQCSGKAQNIISALWLLLNEMALFLNHKCNIRDPDLTKKTIDTLNDFSFEIIEHFFDIGDSNTVMSVLRKHISNLIDYRAQTNNFQAKNPTLEIYETVTLENSDWFWDDRIDMERVKSLVHKFPDYSFIAFSDSSIYSSDTATVHLVIKSGEKYDEVTFSKKSSVWRNGDKSFSLMKDLVYATLLPKIEEGCLFLPVSKWIHCDAVSNSLPEGTFEKLVRDCEFRKAKFHQAWDLAHAQYEAEQASILNARGNNNLRSISHLITLYEQQKIHLQNQVNDHLQPGNDTVNNTMALLDSRLSSLLEQKAKAEGILAEKSRETFVKVKTSLQSKLQIVNLDSNKLRVILGPEVLAAFDEVDEDTWMTSEEMTREQSETTLAEKDDGCFLVRPRDLNSNEPFAVSFRWNGTTNHSLIRSLPFEGQSGFSLLQNLNDEKAGWFNTLSELVNFYKKNSLPIENKSSPGYGAKLLTPFSSK